MLSSGSGEFRLIYVAGFAMSWGPVVWVLLSEMFLNAIKGKVLAAAVAAQWLANLLVSWSFKVLDGNSFLNANFHHGFAYWVYGAMSLLAIGLSSASYPKPRAGHWRASAPSGHRVLNEFTEAVLSISAVARHSANPTTQAEPNAAANRLMARAKAHRGLLPPAAAGVVNLANYMSDVCAAFADVGRRQLGGP